MHVADYVPGEDQSVLNLPRADHALETQSCSEDLGHVNSFVVPPINRYGAFAKRASTDMLSASVAPSSYQELMVGVGK